jgi:alpha-L-fucosidase
MNMAAFDGMLLPALPGRIVACRLLDGSEVTCVPSEQGILITVPQEKWEPLDTVIEMVVEVQ